MKKFFHAVHLNMKLNEEKKTLNKETFINLMDLMKCFSLISMEFLHVQAFAKH